MVADLFGQLEKLSHFNVQGLPGSGSRRTQARSQHQEWTLQAGAWWLGLCVDAHPLLVGPEGPHQWSLTFSASCDCSSSPFSQGLDFWTFLQPPHGGDCHIDLWVGKRKAWSSPGHLTLHQLVLSLESHVMGWIVSGQCEG